MSRCPIDEDGNLIDHIPGLEYYRDFLSPKEQSELLALIDTNPWQEGVIARRQQFYGEVYYHTSFKSKVLQGCGSSINSNNNTNGNESENGSVGDKNLENSNSGNSDIANDESSNRRKRDTNDSNTIINGGDTNANTDNKSSGNGIPIDDSGMKKWLDKTMPFFEKEGLMEAPSQVLINEYKNNMGIASHFEDFDAFGPIILTVSLVSPVYMTLKKPTNSPHNTISNGGNNKNNLNACDTYEDIIKVFLEPGSLLVMKGDARFKYRHGIGKYKWVHLPPSAPPTVTTTSKTNTAAAAATTTTPSKTNTSIKRDDSYRRVSVTIRHLLSTRRKVQGNEDEADTIKDPSVY